MGDRLDASRGPLQALSLPHDHELHPVLPQGPQPGQGDRRSQTAARRTQGLMHAKPWPSVATSDHHGPEAPRRLARQSASSITAVFRTVWTNFAEVHSRQALPLQSPNARKPWPRFAAKRHHLRTLINLRGNRHCGSEALSLETRRNILASITSIWRSKAGGRRIVTGSCASPGCGNNSAFPGADALQVGRRPRRPCRRARPSCSRAAPLQDALAQLSWRFGHFRRARTGVLDAFFLRYAEEAEGHVPFLTLGRTPTTTRPASSATSSPTACPASSPTGYFAANEPILTRR